MSQSNASQEVELKLQPRDEELLDHLWGLDHLGLFVVVERRNYQQRNVYYDSSDHALARAGGSLRWRTFAGSTNAELTYKGASVVHRGVFRRLEVTAILPADCNPLTVTPVPEPLRLVRATTAELASTELVLENDRRELLLHGGEAQIELDLDISTMPNTPYRDLEIEAELVSGTTQVLDDIASLISAIGPVTPSSKGKRARGWAYLRRHQALSRASAQT